jgi:hypothetical protein
LGSRRTALPARIEQLVTDLDGNHALLATPPVRERGTVGRPRAGELCHFGAAERTELGEQRVSRLGVAPSLQNRASSTPDANAKVAVLTLPVRPYTAPVGARRLADG